MQCLYRCTRAAHPPSASLLSPHVPRHARQIPVEAEDVRAERLRVEAMAPGEASAAIAIRDLQKVFPAAGGNRWGCVGPLWGWVEVGKQPAVCPVAFTVLWTGHTTLQLLQVSRETERPWQPCT